MLADSYSVVVRIAAIAVLFGTGCAMRISGTVRDGTSGTPIGGAVLTADDGRNRLTVTDPHGRFAVKTDWDPSTLVVSAPGYQTATVAVPDTDRFPVITVDLVRAFPAPSAAPLVERLGDSQTGGIPAGQPNTEGKLQELQQLYDRGLISDEEYRRTRNRIVEGL